MALPDKSSEFGKLFYTDVSRVMIQSIDYICDDYSTFCIDPCVASIYIKLECEAEELSGIR